MFGETISFPHGVRHQEPNADDATQTDHGVANSEYHSVTRRLKGRQEAEDEESSNGQ